MHVSVYIEDSVHAQHAAGRLERHLRRGFHQHPSCRWRQGRHAPGQSETERI